METLRCPTCLSLLLDDAQARCPSCGRKLGNRERRIVLGESNRISERPVMPIEWELHVRAKAESAAQESRRQNADEKRGRPRRRATKSGRHVDVDEKVDLEAALQQHVAWEPARRVEAAPRFFEPEAVIEAVLFEPEVVDVAKPVVEAPSKPRSRRWRRARRRSRVEEPESARDVVVPEVLVEAEAVTPDQVPDPPPDVIDLSTELMLDSHEASDPSVEEEPQLLSGPANTRVKNVRNKGRRGWIVDYVVRRPPSEEAGT